MVAHQFPMLKVAGSSPASCINTFLLPLPSFCSFICNIQKIILSSRISSYSNVWSIQQHCDIQPWSNLLFSSSWRMSSSQRSIARLPLHIFTDLIQHRDDNPYTPSDLRTAICRKLVDAGRSMSKTSPSLSSEGITAVGQIMRLTSPALLRSLDPLLTNGEK